MVEDTATVVALVLVAFTAAVGAWVLHAIVWGVYAVTMLVVVVLLASGRMRM